jgi:hypothetical protein
VPVWSPDGKQIGLALQDGDGSTEQHVLNADGSDEPTNIASIPDSWYA